MVGGVMVGLWMQSPEEAEIMLRALEARLRNVSLDDRDRKKLEDWRRQAMNMSSRSTNEQWGGWVK